MNPVKVKICGITRGRDLTDAVTLGADAIGMVVDVPTSPRNLSIARAQALLKRVPSNVTRVIVTVPESVTQLQHLYHQLHPDALQVHGDMASDVSAIRSRTPHPLLI